MHPSHYALIALDIAHDRVREAEAHHRYRHELDGPTSPGSPGLARRSAARAALALSRASASIAERLDGRTGEADGLRSRTTLA